MRASKEQHSIVCRGLDGSNPLGFLAAVGLLRATDAARPDDRVTLRWDQMEGGWRAVLGLSSPVEQDCLIEDLHEHLRHLNEHPALEESVDFPFSPEDFRHYSQEARRNSAPERRLWADLACAFGCEATVNNQGSRVIMQDTAWRLLGAGQTRFLKTVRNIVRKTEPKHLEKCLFQPWRYDDPQAGLSLRLDPEDDTRYALRWGDPSSDPTRARSGSMLGANRLAFEALPLFPAVPSGGRLETTGISGGRGRGSRATWPIWTGDVTVDVCRSLLALPEIHQDTPPREELHLRGIAEVYRSRRIRVGRYSSMSPAITV